MNALLAVEQFLGKLIIWSEANQIVQIPQTRWIFGGNLQTHIGYSGIAKNPYGNVGEDRTCDIWSGWTAMTSVQSAALGKKMCKGQIGIYTLSKNLNNCHREIVVQAWHRRCLLDFFI